MSFVALYAENASVLHAYDERSRAIRAAVRIAIERPDLSDDIGVAELDETDGHVISPFRSATDLLAHDDPDAVAAAEEYGRETRRLGTSSAAPSEPVAATERDMSPREPWPGYAGLDEDSRDELLAKKFAQAKEQNDQDYAYALAAAVANYELALELQSDATRARPLEASARRLYDDAGSWQRAS
jgi:hypothetical protein